MSHVQRVVVAALLISSCTAEFSCDPSLHYVDGPDASVGGRATRCHVDCVPVTIESGSFHTLASTEQSGVIGWGDNRYAQLGPGPEVLFVPIKLTPSSTSIHRAAAGTAHSCVYETFVAIGRVECFGLNLSGVSGPVVRSHVEFELSRQIGVASFGAAHGVATLDERPFPPSIAMWGDNHLGQLGVDGDWRSIPFVSRIVDQADAGGYLTCAVRFGELSCSGALALSGDAYEPEAPPDERMIFEGFTAVEGLTSLTSVSVGMSHVCAADEAGDVWCFGANLAGESGEMGGEPTAIRHVNISGPVIALSAGGGYEVARIGEGPLDYDLAPHGAGVAHTCALVGGEGAQVFCWGDNQYGQLGDGTRRSGSDPRRVSLPPILAVSTGARHTCALDATFEVWCWGDNEHGQLGRSPEEWASSEFPLRVELTRGAP